MKSFCRAKKSTITGSTLSNVPAIAEFCFRNVDPDSRRDWFESESSKTYPEYSGH